MAAGSDGALVKQARLRFPCIEAVLASVAIVAGCAGSGSPVAQGSTRVSTGPAITRSAIRGVTSSATRSSPTTHVRPVASPRIIWAPIPFGPVRKAQMVAYVHRHYGSFMKPTWRLIDPHVIVIHYTEASFRSTWNTFANDVPDSELHELPATCTHFVIDTDGMIYQLVSLSIMCRHTVGLNWTAIGIEHVGYSDRQVLRDPRQMASSLRLVRWLRCRFRIPINDVIGHAESLTSPYHREDVPALRSQTHSDFDRADMRIYRHRLGALGPCPTT